METFHLFDPVVDELKQEGVVVGLDYTNPESPQIKVLCDGKAYWYSASEVFHKEEPEPESDPAPEKKPKRIMDKEMRRLWFAVAVTCVALLTLALRDFNIPIIRLGLVFVLAFVLVFSLIMLYPWNRKE